MPSYNKTILAGNLTRNPEVKYTSKGTAIADFGLAINRTWKDESGQTKEEVTFVDITAYGRTAEVIGEHLKKGRPILVEGRLKLDQWEKDGRKYSKLKVICESFQFLDSNGTKRGESRPGEAGGTGADRKIDKEDVPKTGGAESNESDVPF